MTTVVPPSFGAPRTADQWWEQAAYVAAVMPEWGPPDELCDTTLSRSRELIRRHGGQRAVLAYESNRDIPFYSMLDLLIKNRDTAAWNIFQMIWSDAPDASYIHEWKGWGRLCDLCSEVHCIRSEEDSDDE